MSDTEYLLKIAKGIFDEAYIASCNLAIMKQMRELLNEYRTEFRCSIAFYNTVYCSLMQSTTMELAKIYDVHGKAIGIRCLLNECKKAIDSFCDAPTYGYTFQEEEYNVLNGKADSIAVKFQEEFKKCTFNDVVICPVRVLLTAKEYLTIHCQKMNRMKGIIANLSGQRNKAFAHNDKDVCFNFETVDDQYPISFENVQALTSFAIDLSRFVIAELTDIYKSDKPLNIDDLRNTLDYVRIGMKNETKESLDDVQM